MNRKERYQYILDYFQRTQPHVTTQLMFGSAFQLLVATLLSAQCTDKRINEITPALFQKMPDAKTMAQASESQILERIHSVSYPNSKARHLLQMSQQLMDRFHGEVPDNEADLVSLAGVGRKTAHVVLAVWFNKPYLAVDTHVFRVSHRLGLVPATANTPVKVEEYLMHHIPEKYIIDSHHWLLLHGRYIFKSLKTLCEKFPLCSFCPSSRCK